MAPRRHPLLLLSALALVLASFAIAPRPAMAATHTIKVDTLLDLSIADAAGQPYCELPAPEPPQGNCSLRQAIERANSLPNEDTKIISFEYFTDETLARAPFVITQSEPLPAIQRDNVRIEADTSVSFGRRSLR